MSSHGLIFLLLKSLNSISPYGDTSLKGTALNDKFFSEQQTVLLKTDTGNNNKPPYVPWHSAVEINFLALCLMPVFTLQCGTSLLPRRLGCFQGLGVLCWMLCLWPWVRGRGRVDNCSGDSPGRLGRGEHHWTLLSHPDTRVGKCHLSGSLGRMESSGMHQAFSLLWSSIPYKKPSNQS